MAEAGQQEAPKAAPAAPTASQDAAAPKAAAGKKRPAAAHEGQGDHKRRRADFAVGDRGVFFTTVSPAGANNARRDLLRLLESVLEADAVPNSAADSKASVGAKLEAELQQLQNTKPSFALCTHEVAKGTGFLKFSGDAAALAPSEVVARLLETQRAEYQATHMAPSSRLLCRVLPIDHTCKPFLDDFKKLAQAVLPAHLGPDAEPTVWGLEFRARNTNTLKKEAVLEVIDNIVQGRHKVSINDPKKCILVEVNPLFCGLSVLSRWAELKKYNLHALTTPEETRKPSTPQAAAKPAAAAPGAAEAPAAAAAAPAENAAPAPQEAPAAAAEVTAAPANTERPAEATPTAAAEASEPAAASAPPS